MQKNTIEIVPYEQGWIHSFQSESKVLSFILGNNCKAIYHIGSTSVPSLSSKPTIDIMIEIDDILLIDTYNTRMTSIGYEPKGEYGVPFRRYFRKRDTEPTYNLHIFETGHPEIERMLLFRDCLCANSSLLNMYAYLKVQLAQAYPSDIKAYSQGKNQFIQQVLEQAGCTKK